MVTVVDGGGPALSADGMTDQVCPNTESQCRAMLVDQNRQGRPSYRPSFRRLTRRRRANWS